MYDTEVLTEIVDDYLILSRGHPTKIGLAKRLGASTTTIYNVIRGAYNGTPYGKEPHYNRIVDNKDFCLIREVFGEYY